MFILEESEVESMVFFSINDNYPSEFFDDDFWEDVIP